MPDDNKSSSQKAVTLIIPAHNEAKRLTKTLELYHEAFAHKFDQDFELLIVCNGCTDTTVQIANEFKNKTSQTHVLVIDEAVGKGGAIIAGFRAAKGNRVIFADADAATKANSLLDLLEQIDSNDVAIGSRRIHGSFIEQPQVLSRRLFGTAFFHYTRFTFGLPYFDTQCGAKAFTHSAACLLADMISENRWTFDVDLLLSARRLGLTVVEVPVIWTDMPGSRLKVIPTIAQVIQSFQRLKQKELHKRTTPVFSTSISTVLASNTNSSIPITRPEQDLEGLGTN